MANNFTAIPGKQLLEMGSRAELEARLLPREIGYSTEDRQCLMGTSAGLVPVSAPEMTEAEVTELLDSLPGI